MSLSRVKVWVPGEVLTAADLNGEFNNLITNPMALITPLILENLTTSPGTSSAGRIFYHTQLNQIGVDDGTFIRSVPTILSTSITAGDFIIGTSDGSWQRVASDDAAVSFDYGRTLGGAANFIPTL